MRLRILVVALLCTLALGGCGHDIQAPLPQAAGTKVEAQGSRVAPGAVSGGEGREREVEKKAEEYLAKDFFPSAVGNRWEYEAAYSPPLVGGRLAAKAFVEIDGRVAINGKEFFRRTTRIEGVPMPTGQKSSGYTRTAADGIYQVREVPEKTPEFLLMPSVLKVGQRWSGMAGGMQFMGEVAAKETVQCGDKSYPDCLLIRSHVSTKQGSVQQSQWLAAGIGMVRQKQEGWFGVIETHLTRFIPAEPSSRVTP
jgi:hypothetical protein